MYWNSWKSWISSFMFNHVWIGCVMHAIKWFLWYLFDFAKDYQMYDIERLLRCWCLRNNSLFVYGTILNYMCYRVIFENMNCLILVFISVVFSMPLPEEEGLIPANFPTFETVAFGCFYVLPSCSSKDRKLCEEMEQLLMEGANCESFREERYFKKLIS